METLDPATLELERTNFDTHLQPLLLQCYCQHSLSLTRNKADEVLRRVIDRRAESAVANPSTGLEPEDPELLRHVMSCIEMVDAVRDLILDTNAQKPLAGVKQNVCFHPHRQHIIVA